MMTAGGEIWLQSKTGLRIITRVTPKAATDRVEGITETPQGAALKVRVRAVAEKGEANRAVEEVLARWLGIAKGRVSVAAGDKARTKTVEIAGDPRELQALVKARLAAAS
ncbi:MAG TPA: DUF167 family protein [Hyphomicrobiaceae bacterium]|jgi:uncharacterized protein YggU (UPF0235/DUF167 family)|nr:DUF167 family protein [Hyphomicrobiaceae bacterium]